MKRPVFASYDKYVTQVYLESLWVRVHLFSSVAFFFLLALQPPSGVVFYSPLVGFGLLACEVS